MQVRGKKVGGKDSNSDIDFNDEINVKISGPIEVMVKMARKIYTTRCHQLTCRSGCSSRAISTGRTAACACVDTCAMGLLLPYRLLVLGSIKRRWMIVTMKMIMNRITDIAAAKPK